jgi:hypothetical protein
VNSGKGIIAKKRKGADLGHQETDIRPGNLKPSLFKGFFRRPKMHFHVLNPKMDLISFFKIQTQRQAERMWWGWQILSPGPVLQEKVPGEAILRVDFAPTVRLP